MGWNGSGNNWWRAVIFVILCAQWPGTAARQKEMTVKVLPGTVDCFFEEAKAGQTVDIEYQVIDGGHGDLDINFELSEVSGRLIIADHKKSDNFHRHQMPYDGELKFCFDNSISRFNKKTVFFEIIIDADAYEEASEWNESDLPDESFDMTVQDMYDAIKRVQGNLSKARQLQDMLRSHEARDRNMAEENFFKVNTWSFFQIVTMIAVGMLQVTMLKSLFDVDSRAYKLLAKS